MTFVVETGDGRLAVVEERAQGEVQVYYNPIPWLFPPGGGDGDDGDILPDERTVIRLTGQSITLPGITARRVRPRGAEGDGAEEERAADGGSVAGLIRRWPEGCLTDRERRLTTIHTIAWALRHPAPQAGEEEASGTESSNGEVTRILDVLRGAPCGLGIAADVLEDDITFVLKEMAAPSSSPPRFVPPITHEAALDKLRTPPPEHGFDKQAHLPAKIVDELRRWPTAWREIRNLKECVACVATIATLHHARKRIIVAVAEELAALPAGVKPTPDLTRRASDICAKYADRVLLDVELALNIQQAPTEPALVGEEELDRINAATDVYTFIGLDPDTETGGPEYLLMMLDGDHGDETDDDGKPFVTQRSTIGRRLDKELTPDATDAVKKAFGRLSSVRRLLKDRDPLVFEMYRAIHQYARSRGVTFQFQFNPDVNGRSLLWRATKFMINDLQVFRTRQRAVFKRERPAYTYVGTVATFLTTYAFRDDMLEPFRTYLHSVRGASQDAATFDRDALAMASSDIFWPPTELDKRWYACKNGLYDMQERAFHKHGTPEYARLSDTVTPYVYFPDSEWIDESGDSGGASTTPNFDKVFAAQDITGNARRFVRAMLGRSAYAVGTLDNWHATLFIKGRAGTGKSTLLEHVAAKWHPAGLVGTLGNLSGGVGQYVHILDKELVIVTEIGDTFGGNGFAQTWLKMTEGAFLDFPVPRQPNWEGKWSAPLLHCGNNYFAWPDPLGAVARRVGLVPFVHKVQDGDSQLPKKLMGEMIMIIHKCQVAYRALLDMYHDKTFDAMLRAECPELAELVQEASLEKDGLAEFFEQCIEPATSVPDGAKSSAEFASAVADRRLERCDNRLNTGWIKATKDGAPVGRAAFSAFSLNALNISYETWRRFIKPGAKQRSLSFPDAEAALGQWIDRSKDTRGNVFLYRNKGLDKPLVRDSGVTVGRPNTWFVNANLRSVDPSAFRHAPPSNEQKGGDNDGMIEETNGK